MAAGRLPTFLIVGVPKAGTAALAWALGQQPGVFSHPAKELHFFDENAHRGLDWYRARFSAANGASIVGEATPTYALRDEWTAAAADALPDARVIVQVRHPVDRFRSSYWFFSALGLETRTPEQVVDEEARDDTPISPFSHVSAGWYDHVHTRLVTAWSPDQVLVVDAGQLRHSPAETVARAARHIGVANPVEVEPGEDHNRITMRRSQTAHRLLLAGRRRGWIKPRSRIARTWLRLNSTGERPPPLDPVVRQRLLAHYEPHIQRFEEAAGLQLPEWRT